MALLKYLFVVFILLFSMSSVDATNVVLGKTPTVTGFWVSSPTNLGNAVDGDYATVTGGSIFEAAYTIDTADDLSYFQIDVGGYYNLTSVTIKTGFGNDGAAANTSIRVKSSTDGIIWSTIMTNTTANTYENLINITTPTSNTKVHYFRISVWRDSGVAHSNFRVYEIQAEGSPANISVGNWTFNEGTGTYANDSSGFNNNGTVSGATWSTNLVNGSVSSTSLSYGGAGSDTIPTSSSLNASTAITIAGWYKQTANPGTFPALIKKNSAYATYVHTDGRVYAELNISGSLTSTYSPALPIFPTNGWHYVSVTYDGSNIITYYDNVGYVTTAAPGSISLSSDSLVIGNGINGTMDEWKVFNYALNSTERTTEYQRFHPVPAYPVGGLVIPATVPPMTSSITFSWHDTVYPSDELIVASDSNFNLIVADVYTSADTYTLNLVPGTYYWKINQFNSTSSTFGITSAIQTFTISGSSAATGTGIDGVVYELINNVQTPITDATVTIYNSTYSSTQTTGSNGYYLFTGLANSSTYNIVASKQGYDTTTAYPVTTGNGTVLTNNILMKIYISPYVPNFVFEKFIVRGLFDNAFPGVTVNVYEGAAITPKFTGTTDSIGQAVFQLIKDKYYRVTFSGGGLSSTVTAYIYAKEESYLITIASGFPTGGDRFKDILTNLTVITFNTTYSNLSLIYNDTRSSTTLVSFYARNLTTNATSCSISNNSSQAMQLNCTVLASGSYQFGYTASSSIYGIFKEDKVVNFAASNISAPLVPIKPPTATTGASRTIMQWASIMLIVLTAALFSVRTVKFGAVIVPIEALVLQVIGWFEADIILLSIAVVLGVLVYMRLSEVKVNY